MATIEERAREYADNQEQAELELHGLGHVYGYSQIYNSEKVAYERGATEQKAIDIMRVRQFLERESAYNGSMTCIDDLLIEELCKTMEE